MARHSMLIVEDDPTLRAFLVEVASRAEFAVKEDPVGDQALKWLEGETFDVVLSDMKLPRADGLSVLRAARRNSPETVVILMTAFGTVDLAVQAMKEGALEFLQKPFGVEIAETLLRSVRERLELGRDSEILRRGTAASPIVGIEGGLREVGAIVAKVADSDAGVLIQGESGTGKELVARELHARSRRASRRFMALNVAAIPDTMIEAELFGYEKGAFTGAVARRIGLVELADGGTLFLDEVGDLAESAQVKFLRFLQERTFRRLGGSREIPVDVRVICATHRNLQERVAEGRFREDLFYRLNVVPLRLPPLRERKGDIPGLVAHFLADPSRRRGRPALAVAPRVMREFLDYDWPGNVRELENIVERAAALAEGDIIETSYLASGPSQASAPSGKELPLAEYLEEVERRRILEALEKEGGVRSRAAERLGIKRTTLVEKINRLGIVFEARKPEGGA